MAGSGGVKKWIKFLFTGEKQPNKPAKPKTTTAQVRPDNPEVEAEEVSVRQPRPTGGALYATTGFQSLSKNKREEIRNRMLEQMGEEGVKALDEILTAPRDMRITCPKCNNKMLVKPPTSDKLRLQVVEILGKFAVGTRHDEEVHEQYVLVVDV